MIPVTDVNNNIDRNCELRSSLKEEERERKLTLRKRHLIFLRNNDKKDRGFNTQKSC